MAKHLPVRTCVACRQQRYKDELLRIARTPTGRVEVDPHAKKPGRGAYVCYNSNCMARAVTKGHLGRSLKTRVPAELLEQLLNLLDEC